MDEKLQKVCDGLLDAILACTQERRDAGGVVVHYTDAPGAKMFADALSTVLNVAFLKKQLDKGK